MWGQSDVPVIFVGLKLEHRCTILQKYEISVIIQLAIGGSKDNKPMKQNFHQIYFQQTGS